MVNSTILYIGVFVLLAALLYLVLSNKELVRNLHSEEKIPKLFWQLLLILVIGFVALFCLAWVLVALYMQ